MTKRHVHLVTCATALVIASVLAGCGSSGTSSSTATSSTTAASGAAAAPAAGGHAHVVTVAITSYAFHPASLVVSRGTRVRFINHDSTAHTATTTSPGFDSGTLKQGQSATVTLTRSGSYAYICQFHAFMHGTVTVN